MNVIIANNSNMCILNPRLQIKNPIPQLIINKIPIA